MTKSTMDTLAVGTRIARPFSLPASDGITRPMALAAPVLVGTIFCAAARASHLSAGVRCVEKILVHRVAVDGCDEAALHAT